MNLQDLDSALPKPWLNIKANSLQVVQLDADSLAVDSIESKYLTVENRGSVPNPAINNISLYSDLAGELKTNDNAGNVNSIISQAIPGVVGNFPVYDTSGTKLVDSSSAPADYALLSGATFTGTVSAPAVVSGSLPVPNFRAAQVASWTPIFANAAEIDMVSGPITGSLAIDPTTPEGFTLDMKFLYLYSSGLLTTCTFRFKVNGATVLTTVVPAATTVNQYCTLQYLLQIQENGTRILLSSTLLRNLGATQIDATLLDGVWNQSATNTLSVTAQFSDVGGTLGNSQFYISSSQKL